MKVFSLRNLFAMSLVASSLIASNVASAHDKYEGVGPDDHIYEDELSDGNFSIMMNPYLVNSGSYEMKTQVVTKDVKLTNAASQVSILNNTGSVLVTMRTAANGSYSPVTSKTFKKGTSTQYMNNTSSNHKKSAWVDYRIVNNSGSTPVKGKFQIYDLR
ncbi:hypothetical protein MKY91_19620 [Alkalicoccobacillus gibsonii]|uniref:DUF5626 domain-containing protein n=1 Tax=Alkalicoccobacillus gibsonii TaxID=79881 RepID=A0ABU9VQD5_9BACI